MAQSTGKCMEISEEVKYFSAFSLQGRYGQSIMPEFGMLLPTKSRPEGRRLLVFEQPERTIEI
jgi:hypothetical protein